jgi:hypothetical protein
MIHRPMQKYETIPISSLGIRKMRPRRSQSGDDISSGVVMALK